MKRVKKGENYYWLNSLLEVCSSIEYYNSTSYAHYRCGNYFHTQEEAEAMARKLRAVLNGADVIKMPSEEEFEMIAKMEYPTSTQIAFNSGVNWLKSKIMK